MLKRLASKRLQKKLKALKEHEEEARVDSFASCFQDVYNNMFYACMLLCIF